MFTIKGKSKQRRPDVPPSPTGAPPSSTGSSSVQSNAITSTSSSYTSASLGYTLDEYYQSKSLHHLGRTCLSHCDLPLYRRHNVC